MNNDATAKKQGIIVYSSSSDSERDEEEVVVKEKPPLTWCHPITLGNNRTRLLSKQLSMKETTREAQWERRRRQILQRSCVVTKQHNQGNAKDIGDTDVEEGTNSGRLMRERVRSLTDEDLDELRGSIELGFGFNEEDGGQHLCDTLPALDLYFAVNRRVSDTKLRLPTSPYSILSATSSSSTLCGTPSPRSPNEMVLPSEQSAPNDSWSIFNPGDNPQLVKTRLRHWAQVVACSVKHFC